MVFDVAVIGAGPAGAWAASCLARGGARVALFDPSHPREKPCGGGITSRALSIVGPYLPALPSIVPATARFEDNGALADVPLRCGGPSENSSMIVATRRAFDGALLNAAQARGAELIVERATAIDMDAGGVAIRTPARVYRAAFVLGADGANSLVRRRLSRAFTRAQLSIAVGVFVHDVSDDAIVIRCANDPSGYLWSFPRADHLAVGICAQADVSGPAMLKQHVSSWLAGSGSLPRDRVSSARHSAYAWPIPSLGPADFGEQQVSGDRWMLLGDAAGLVDPITREGIFYALLSAEYAAAALLNDSENAGTAYRRQLQTRVYPELKRAAMLKRRFFTSGFTVLMVEALARSGPIRQVMVDLIEGRQPYIGLGRRLLRTGEVRLAWRLLRQRF